MVEKLPENRKIDDKTKQKQDELNKRQQQKEAFTKVNYT